MEPKGVPKWSQNGTKIAPKFELGPSWGHLGLSWGLVGHSWDLLGPSWAILGPLWSHLGASLEPSWGLFGAILGSLVAILGPSWGHLGELSRQNAREAPEAKGESIQADQRHAERIILALGLEAANSVATPCDALRNSEEGQGRQHPRPGGMREAIN